MGFDRAVFADRSERLKLRFSGPQAAWFLHQTLTQAFEDMRPGEARESAMLTVHGRMTAYAEFLATDDGLLAHAEPELRATLPDAIRAYVFATQVEIEDVTDEYGLVLVAGPDHLKAAQVVGGAVAHPTASLGVPAAYLWIPRGYLTDALVALKHERFEEASEDELEAVRIGNGVARWGRDMDDKTFPQEALVDERAVHFEKGCYLGQEAMAKIHFRGKVNRHLRRLETTGPVRAGEDVFLEERKVGRVTSVAQRAALAMLHRDVPEGAEVQAGEGSAVVRFIA